MSIAALITEGIGPGGSVLFVMTGGLSIGAVADIWTPVTPGSATWNPETDSTDIWTPVTPAASPWA